MTIPAADILEAVRARYGGRADALLRQGPAACCGTDVSCCGAGAGGGGVGVNAFSEGLYAIDQLEGVPLSAALATLGCGNPVALAALRPGDIVLDLGSGSGLDVILAARLIGPTGHAYGIDVTDQMLALAWRNAAAAGLSNITFLRGDITTLPVPDCSIDVVISNCVINLTIDKPRVISEIFRATRPGGRVALSDVVIMGGLPENVSVSHDLRQDVAAWASCLAGALSDTAYRSLLIDAGFIDVELEVVRRHTTSELFPGDLPDWASRADRVALDAVSRRFTSTLVRAVRPRVGGLESEPADLRLQASGKVSQT